MKIICSVGTIILPAILSCLSTINNNNKIDIKWALLNPFYVVLSGWKVFRNPKSEEKKTDHWQYKVTKSKMLVDNKPDRVS